MHSCISYLPTTIFQHSVISRSAIDRARQLRTCSGTYLSAGERMCMYVRDGVLYLSHNWSENFPPGKKTKEIKKVPHSGNQKSPKFLPRMSPTILALPESPFPRSRFLPRHSKSARKMPRHITNHELPFYTVADTIWEKSLN